MQNSDAHRNGLRILIIRISAIGDVLHVTSVVHNLRRLLPDAEIARLRACCSKRIPTSTACSSGIAARSTRRAHISTCAAAGASSKKHAPS